MKVLLKASFMLLTSSCNHLFYYPHKELYHRPSELKLNYEEVEIKSTDDVVLKAWKIPALQKEKAKTVILQLHGNAENRSTHFISVVWVVEHGIDLVSVDYRGYNGSTGQASRGGLVDDVMSAIDWLAKNYPDSKRVIVAQSIGGSVAIPALAKIFEKEGSYKIDGLVIESSFHSYRGIARMKLASVWLLWPLQWLPWILLSGTEDPIDYAEKVSLPLLIFHDKKDPVVPYESGEALYTRLPGGLKSLVNLDEGQHSAAFYNPQGVPRQQLLHFVESL